MIGRAALGPLLRPWLRQSADSVARRAARFHITRDGGRERVERLGGAFLDGYHAMLAARDPGDVAALGERVDSLDRPFFFEGAAMGWLPRGLWDARCTSASAEAGLLAIDERYLYLYYVGLGFWYGFRHPRRPERLETLAAEVEPLYAPLLWDGFGFKAGFFDYDLSAGVDRRVLARVASCTQERRFAAWQGLGRALHFVFMDDPEGRARVVEAAPAEHRADLEWGRSLALGFSGTDRPDTIVRHLEQARDEAELGVRLGGVTWAMTAWEMCDPDAFERCLRAIGGPLVPVLEAMPALCHRARETAPDYRAWQIETRRQAAVRWHAASRAGSRGPSARPAPAQ